MGEFLLGVDVVAHVAQLLLHDPEDGDGHHGEERDADDRDERTF